MDIDQIRREVGHYAANLALHRTRAAERPRQRVSLVTARQPTTNPLLAAQLSVARYRQAIAALKLSLNACLAQPRPHASPSIETRWHRFTTRVAQGLKSNPRAK
jgi:hypothetical protein